jgi:hypothetical protein
MMPRQFISGAYLGLALLAWTEFLRPAPGGLAQVSLFPVTLPVAFFGLIESEVFRSGTFVLLPAGFGSFGDRAACYLRAVAIAGLPPYWLAGILGEAVK